MPVFSSHLLNDPGVQVGQRIREERARRGLTLRELATQLEMSAAKLSNVETGKVSVDLGELSRVATALHVSVASLFPKTRLRHYYIKRAADVAAAPGVNRELTGPDGGPERHHNPVRPLADPFVGKHIEPVLAEIRPLDDKDVHFISHDHEEFVFVLLGEVETLLKTNDGIVKESLKAGDAMYFRSNLPHCHRSAGGNPAETINVIYSLRGIDPHDSELGLPGRRYYRRGVYADASREASEKIALLRRTHGVTLAELASELNIGVRQLANIESGEKAPDVDLLLRVARRFRRPIEYFFATTLDAQPYFIQRGGDLPSVTPRHRRVASDSVNASPNVFRPLAAGFAERGMHPFYVQVTAGPAQGKPHEHHGQEFVYILNGELELVTYDGDETSEILRPGDALFLESSVPHLLRGYSRNPYASTYADLIAVFWSPLGEDYLFDA
jgi:transcriptional regulator with XRE-family HTH domain/quercetin dioxygenase-like cupin family protein